MPIYDVQAHCRPLPHMSNSSKSSSHPLPNTIIFVLPQCVLSTASSSSSSTTLITARCDTTNERLRPMRLPSFSMYVPQLPLLTIVQLNIHPTRRQRTDGSISTLRSAISFISSAKVVLKALPVSSFSILFNSFDYILKHFLTMFICFHF